MSVGADAYIIPAAAPLAFTPETEPSNVDVDPSPSHTDLTTNREDLQPQSQELEFSSSPPTTQSSCTTSASETPTTARERRLQAIERALKYPTFPLNTQWRSQPTPSPSRVIPRIPPSSLPPSFSNFIDLTSSFHDDTPPKRALSCASTFTGPESEDRFHLIFVHQIEDWMCRRLPLPDADRDAWRDHTTDVRLGPDLPPPLGLVDPFDEHGNIKEHVDDEFDEMLTEFVGSEQLVGGRARKNADVGVGVDFVVSDRDVIEYARDLGKEPNLDLQTEAHSKLKDGRDDGAYFFKSSVTKNALNPLSEFFKNLDAGSRAANMTSDPASDSFVSAPSWPTSDQASSTFMNIRGLFSQFRNSPYWKGKNGLNTHSNRNRKCSSGYGSDVLKKSLFQAAVKTFQQAYGTDESDIRSWRALCRDLGFEESEVIGLDWYGCKQKVLAVHVNIWDLLHAHLNNQLPPQTFSTTQKLAEYTLDNGLIWPRSYVGEERSVLKALLRKIVDRG